MRYQAEPGNEYNHLGLLYYRALRSLAPSLFNCFLCKGCRLTRPKWLRSIALALEIAILLLLSFGGGNLRKYPHAAGNHALGHFAAVHSSLKLIEYPLAKPDALAHSVL